MPHCAHSASSFFPLLSGNFGNFGNFDGYNGVAASGPHNTHLLFCQGEAYPTLDPRRTSGSRPNRTELKPRTVEQTEAEAEKTVRGRVPTTRVPTTRVPTTAAIVLEQPQPPSLVLLHHPRPSDRWVDSQTSCLPLPQTLPTQTLPPVDLQPPLCDGVTVVVIVTLSPCHPQSIYSANGANSHSRGRTTRPRPPASRLLGWPTLTGS